MIVRRVIARSLLHRERGGVDESGVATSRDAQPRRRPIGRSLVVFSQHLRSQHGQGSRLVLRWLRCVRAPVSRADRKSLRGRPKVVSATFDVIETPACERPRTERTRARATHRRTREPASGLTRFVFHPSPLSQATPPSGRRWRTPSRRFPKTETSGGAHAADFRRVRSGHQRHYRALQAQRGRTRRLPREDGEDPRRHRGRGRVSGLVAQRATRALKRGRLGRENRGDRRRRSAFFPRRGRAPAADARSASVVDGRPAEPAFLARDDDARRTKGTLPRDDAETTGRRVSRTDSTAVATTTPPARARLIAGTTADVARARRR